MAITTQKIRQEILNNPELKIAIAKQAKKVFEQSKMELIEDFNSHPVTKEIESGPNASNESRTLGGRGNLFSFIGFEDGINPVEPVRTLLDKIKLAQSNPRVRNNAFEFRVNIPEQSEFESVTKMPWQAGRSWLYDIERSISGLGQYLYGVFSKSRSGSAVQVERNVNGSNFSPVRYFGAMIEKFKNNLNGG